jgi:hypothetical protein
VCLVLVVAEDLGQGVAEVVIIFLEDLEEAEERTLNIYLKLRSCLQQFQ